MSLFAGRPGAGGRLRACLEEGVLVQAPGCYDALSARILEQAGVRAAFLGGFSVAAARLGLPDTGLLSYGEMLDQARNVCAATALPVIGDADTGYGNAMNAERAVHGCASAGLACMMIEDQQWPKRCGHTAGKEIVARDEALARVRAAVRARDEAGLDLLIMARTDAIATDGLDEALWRATAFADLGAELSFVEALADERQIERYATEVPGFRTVNLVEDGKTPWLDRTALESLGIHVVLQPVTLLLHAAAALREASRELASGGEPPADGRLHFDALRELVGWPEYEERLQQHEHGAGRDPS